MQYNGLELTEITEPQVFNPPRKMIVWDNDANKKELTVVAIIAGTAFPVITLNDAGHYDCFYSHCAEIPKEQNQQKPEEQKQQKPKESLQDFVSMLGTPRNHKDMSVRSLIEEVLDVQEHTSKADLLYAFIHGMLAGLKIAGEEGK